MESGSSLYQGRNLTVTTRLGDLDVVQRLPGIPTWEQLAAEAEATTLGDLPVEVCSRTHLIAMKRARASRPPGFGVIDLGPQWNQIAH